MRLRTVILFILSAAAVLCAAFFIGRRVTEKQRIIRTADEYMAQEKYEQAKELYTLAGETDRLLLCDELILERDYLSAVKLMQAERYIEAKAHFDALDGYKDSSNMALACQYFHALELCRDENAYEAVNILTALGTYPGAERELLKARRQLYERAVQDTYEFKLSEAVSAFDLLGDYERSLVYAEQCRKLQSYCENDKPRHISEDKLFKNGYYKNAYTCDLGYFTVPEKCDSNTRFFLYFPGGMEEQISVDFFYYYLMNPAPNTVALFLYKNGLKDMKQKTAEAISMLREIAAEKGCFVHDITLCGSSMGVYSALHGVLYCFDDHALDVKSLLSLDAGNDWQASAMVLTPKQCEHMVQTGVQLYLYESPFVGMNRAAIWELVTAGNKVTMVACTYDEHERISYDALGLGVIDWALGERKNEFRTDIYKYIPLTPSSTYPM